MTKASEQEEGEGVNLHVVETEWEVKNFHKHFHVFEKGGVGRERNKTYMMFFCEQIELRMAPKFITKI